MLNINAGIPTTNEADEPCVVGRAQTHYWDPAPDINASNTSLPERFCKRKSK